MTKVKLDEKEVESLKELSTEYQKMKSNQNEMSEAKQAPTQKYWNELTVEEKIERMRVNVKNIDARCAQIGSSLNNLRNEVDMLFDHSHEEDGKLVIKISKEQRFRLTNQLGGLASQLGTTLMGPKVLPDSETYF